MNKVKGMVRKLGTLFVLLLTAVVSFAQSVADSTLAILEDMAVPLVEKRHVANTDFKDNWYLGLYGGVVSNFGSDASHAGFFQVTCCRIDFRQGNYSCERCAFAA